MPNWGNFLTYDVDQRISENAAITKHFTPRNFVLVHHLNHHGCKQTPVCERGEFHIKGLVPRWVLTVWNDLTGSALATGGNYNIWTYGVAF